MDERRAIRKRWQADARELIGQDEPSAYYSAQRLAARARAHSDNDEFWHWAKVASEIARLSPVAEMDGSVVERIVEEELGFSRLPEQE
ncbi:hypothetical protein BZU93_25900 [Salmonella enterica subsp. enterica]|jgi:hypothetical protein|nr:hypothetical protein [Salmonella enterica subsp. enterica serovar Newport]ECI7685813.1 hypothetical protein [Salmonella enterica subsp. enterica serovar Paratyphi A]MIL09293.1 hypothetical protein [Salmonella enterica subsp. enterica serovar Enteritidis]